jgi:hypothetical protein
MKSFTPAGAGIALFNDWTVLFSMTATWKGVPMEPCFLVLVAAIRQDARKARWRLLRR